MKNLLTNLCTFSIFAIGMVSCSTDEIIQSDINNNAITFTSNMTRASGTSWSANDEIGVYMKVHDGTTWDGKTVVNDGANVAYTTTNGDGIFKASSSALTYPKESKDTYDFIAYYPFSANVKDGVYGVNITNQSKPADIDLLYSDDQKDVPSSSKVNSLSFSHKLAYLKLTITSTDNKDISGLKVTVPSVPATADFNLKDATFTNVASAKSDITMHTSSTGTTLTASAFLIPQENIEGELKVRITPSGDDSKSQEVTLADDSKAPISKLESGKSYTVNINVKNVGTTITPATYARWMETPTITDAQLKNTRLQYVTHSFKDNGKQVRNYSLLYNKDLKVAYWVAYPLNNYYTKKTVDRTDAWAYDPNVDKVDQANIIAGSYNNGKYDYDRGHQIPSGDRVVTGDANAQTFYATNMTPQVGKKMNQSIWANLENKVRGWSSIIDTLYVVTGAGFNDETKVTYTTDKDRKKVAVPDYYYKAILKLDRTTGEAKTIAYKMDNKNYPNNDFTKYAISVSQLEELTGFTFFPDIDEKYKAKFDPKDWQ